MYKDNLTFGSFAVSNLIRFKNIIESNSTFKIFSSILQVITGQNHVEDNQISDDPQYRSIKRLAEIFSVYGHFK